MPNQLLKLAFVVVLTLIAIDAQGGQLDKWEGLCIPQHRVTWMMPGGGPQFSGPFAEALLHKKSRLPGFSIPALGVEFSGEELAAAIPGYLATYDYKLSDGSNIRLHLGSVVLIEPNSNAAPFYSADSTQNLEGLWNLTGIWAGAQVSRLNGTPYYMVTRKPDPTHRLSFTLVKNDPLKKGKNEIAFTPISKWYIGNCGVKNPVTPSMGFRCERALIGRTFRVHYSVDGKNINLIDQIDRFIENHIEKWATNCNTVSK